MTICTCGRAFTHCKSCGFKAVYRAKIKSASRTKELGREMNVFTCPRCGSDTDETDVCSASNFKRLSTIIKEDVTKRPAVGTNEYVTAAETRFNELKEEGLDETKAIFRMKSEGWIFEESVPKAEVPFQEPLKEEPDSPPTEPVPLERVLEIMREQSVADKAKHSNIDLNKILTNLKRRKEGLE